MTLTLSLRFNPTLTDFSRGARDDVSTDKAFQRFGVAGCNQHRERAGVGPADIVDHKDAMLFYFLFFCACS